MPQNEKQLSIRPEFQSGPLPFGVNGSVGRMESIVSAAGEVAGHGLRMHYVFQDLTQAKDIYGDRWQTFVANSGVVQCFSANDIFTAEWISKRLGRTTVAYSERSGASGMALASQPFAGTGRTETVDLLAPHEVMRYFAREDRHLRQLLLVSGQPPLVCQKGYYDKIKMVV
ncbi:type IV secretory system conjugative DNA transfer family protein [Stratiformator vulcanicus]|uniref:Type IV secretory system Conjugative DNA transfer n=1 Tax=Stratiformator vulcanicus TaxID=2527980 RepID=A0A517QWK6_9PLAN|nr:type IV secretory system conjugative DNA transfer family protein [Stratiformator vulcanicus]QDT36055.1 Type IV secretory system Conjugative DNA transfer [Stratiformator vulcanicus]